MATVLQNKIHINDHIYSIPELLMKFSIGISLILSPVQDIIGAIIILVLIDFATGIWAAYKKEGRDAVTSRKMSFTVSKILLYTLTILSAMILATFELYDLSKSNLLSFLSGQIATHAVL